MGVPGWLPNIVMVFLTESMMVQGYKVQGPYIRMKVIVRGGASGYLTWYAALPYTD